MINKGLDQITLVDINDLITNSVAEKKTIEYKERLPDNSDSGKKEFLADISSLANASGGDLIFGIKAVQGLPVKLIGIEGSNIDGEVLKYENLIRDGIDPRIALSIKTVETDNKQTIFIFRVNKSWLGPHRVIYKGHDKFYSRNSAGKYPLDTSELRTAFNLSQTLVERIQKFRLERISELYANNTPLVSFHEGAKIILHLIPFEAFNPNQSLDLRWVNDNYDKMPPIYTIDGWNHKINFDGTIIYSNMGYAQLYRTGIIEAVDRGMLEIDRQGAIIPSGGFEKKLIEALTNYIKILKEFKINPPIAVMLTLSGVKDYRLATKHTFHSISEDILGKDILQLPETIIETLDIQAEQILKPSFDLIWNCYGFEKSDNFDEQGNWVDK